VPDKPILAAVHRPGGFHKLDGRPVPTPDTGRRVFLFAGIAGKSGGGGAVIAERRESPSRAQ
jgi:hypothetical protein